jgi:colanic acid/amylovoran biosynthesis glycosyltransferase
VLTVAYLAVQFPAVVEPYVADEIEELRSRGVRVVAGSVREPQVDQLSSARCAPEIVLQSLRLIVALRALWFCMREWKKILPLVGRAILRGSEPPSKRIKTLAHTWLGACYAVLLEGKGVDHIHVHHGYFGSWIAMVAARLLNTGFSMTLHGSDLLLHGAYLDLKLESCSFCTTISEYNRRYILEHYPSVDAAKVIVAHMGVQVSECGELPDSSPKTDDAPLRLLAVGRLHAVKDHAFLVEACAQLLSRNVPFQCSIAGEGPERRNLEVLIRESRLEGQVSLLGHVAREQMDSCYDEADVVVLTSRSEGIPLVLMEAMARGKIVLAPAITGIPELVIAGKTGFLYESGSLSDFVARLLVIRSLMQAPESPDLRPYIVTASRQLNWIRQAAQEQVRHNFNRCKNLESLGDILLRRIASQTESIPHEDLVLQQI